MKMNENNSAAGAVVTAGAVGVAGEKAAWHAPMVEHIQVAAMTASWIDNGNDGGGGMTAGTPPIS